MPDALATGLGAKLIEDQSAGSLYADLAGRIYENEAPEDAALPLLTWEVVTDEPRRTFDNDHLQTVIQFNLYGDADSGAKALELINDKLYLLLNRQTFSLVGYSDAQGLCDDLGSVTTDGLAHIIVSQYTIWATKP
jgi:hypothetical protein